MEKLSPKKQTTLKLTTPSTNQSIKSRLDNQLAKIMNKKYIPWVYFISLTLLFNFFIFSRIGLLPSLLVLVGMYWVSQNKNYLKTKIRSWFKK